MSDRRPRHSQQNRPGNVVLTERDTARVHAFILRIGNVNAAKARLGLGSATFDAVRGYGLMMTTTRERVLDALAREGA